MNDVDENTTVWKIGLTHVVLIMRWYQMGEGVNHDVVPFWGACEYVVIWYDVGWSLIWLGWGLSPFVGVVLEDVWDCLGWYFNTCHVYSSRVFRTWYTATRKRRHETIYGSHVHRLKYVLYSDAGSNKPVLGKKAMYREGNVRSTMKKYF